MYSLQRVEDEYGDEEKVIPGGSHHGGKLYTLRTFHRPHPPN